MSKKADNLRKIIHKSIFVKLSVLDRENTFFLVWTTTPWTLPANQAVALNPKVVYVLVKTPGKILPEKMKRALPIVYGLRLRSCIENNPLRDVLFKVIRLD